MTKQETDILPRLKSGECVRGAFAELKVARNTLYLRMCEWAKEDERLLAQDTLKEGL